MQHFIIELNGKTLCWSAKLTRSFSGAGIFCGDALWRMLIQPVQASAVNVAEDLKHAAQSVAENVSNAAKEVADDLS